MNSMLRCLLLLACLVASSEAFGGGGVKAPKKVAKAAKKPAAKKVVKKAAVKKAAPKPKPVKKAVVKKGVASAVAIVAHARTAAQPGAAGGLSTAAPLFSSQPRRARPRATLA